jgi:peptide/nickel transport system substrate-binding protein
VVENAGTEPLEEFIGTGPYMFVDRQADAFIRMARFEDYVGLEGEPNGYAGSKAAYIDELEFIPVPDEAARIAGLQAGEYHYLESIVSDQYNTLKDDPNVVAEILPPSGWDVMVLNTESPLMSDVTIRQAFVAAINCDEVALAANGEGFYRLDPSFMLQETVWHSTVSEELYNQGDPERCQELLDQAGYDGTPLRFMTTQEYLDQYNMAVVARQQLEAGGFIIEELEIFDWATVNERRTDPELWDVFTTGFSFRVDPIQMPPLSGCSWPGWWCTDAKVAAAATLQSSSTNATRLTRKSNGSGTRKHRASRLPIPAVSAPDYRRSRISK